MKTPVIILITIAISVVIGISIFTTARPSLAQGDVEIIGHNATFLGSTGYYTLSGKVVNKGSDPSGPVTIGIKITDNENGLLYSGTTSPQPRVLQPQQEAYFSAKIDLRKYVNASSI